MSARAAISDSYDVVVVGAGPAGTSAAIALATRGARVALVDKARFPRVKPCAEYLNPQAMAIIERLGLLERVRAAGAAVFRGMEVVSPGGQRMALDFTADAGRHALGLSRLRLDALAVERCQELGVELIDGARVRELLRAGGDGDGGGVRGVRATRRGATLELRGRVTIGADGHHSAVARLLELDRPVRWPRRIGLAAHLEGYALHDAPGAPGLLGEMHVAPDGYCGMAPQEDGRVNAAMVVELARFERRDGSVDDFFEAELRRYPRMRERIEASVRVTPVRGVGPLARRVARAWDDGVVLAGDAAGFFDPFTGEGIYDALRGGELAADAVAAALESGDFSARGLARYGALRREAFAAKRRAAWLVQAFVRSPRLMDYAVARIGARPQVAATMTGVLGDYRHAGIVLTPGFLARALRP